MEILIRPKCSRCGKDIVVIGATDEQLQNHGPWMCEGCFLRARYPMDDLIMRDLREYERRLDGPPRRLEIE